jgi:hypothetical protein
MPSTDSFILLMFEFIQTSHSYVFTAYSAYNLSKILSIDFVDFLKYYYIMILLNANIHNIITFTHI